MDKLPVNIVDLIVFAVLLLSALLALFRGFVREVLSILGWIAALAVTFYGFSAAEPIAKQYISSDWLAALAAGAALFLPTLVFCSILTYLIAERVRTSAISAVDRSLGFLFGLARGAVIVVLAWWGVDKFVIPSSSAQPAWLAEAKTRPLAVAGYQWLEARALEQLSGTRSTRGSEPAQPRPTPIPNRQPISGNADSAKESGYKSEERKGIESLIRSQDKP